MIIEGFKNKTYLEKLYLWNYYKQKKRIPTDLNKIFVTEIETDKDTQNLSKAMNKIISINTNKIDQEIIIN